jgi:uncharacterized membrane protein YkoI
MPVPRLFSTVILYALIAGTPALAADQQPRNCLSKTEQRAAVAANKAIPLTQAVKSVRDRGNRAEVVRARLCRRDETLVYVLTLLSPSGKVIAVNVDAGTGETR